LQRGKDFVQISHWIKGDGRQPFKLFAGNQVGAQLVTNMLYGDPKERVSKGFKDLFRGFDRRALQDPFSEVCAVGGRFGFDARGGWDALRIGTSLDKQSIMLKIAPHVELLAAIGLENARPSFLSTYEIRYATWGGVLPVALSRVALAAPHTFLPKDRFRFFRAHLGDDKQYKKCFFAELEE
jgi:CRISPR-associated protein Csx14